MRKKIIYYTDPLRDDFALTHGKILRRKIDGTYDYRHASRCWRAVAFVLYRVIATPLVFLLMKVFFGLRIKNRLALRRLKGGYFLYGNHTHGLADSFLPSLLTFPRQAFIVTAPDAVSIPFVGKLTEMLGAVPLPSGFSGMRPFLATLRENTRKATVTIYPEAHLWPYYNRIRPFSEASFRYPIQFRVPAVGFTVTYRRRWLFRGLPPRITVTVGEPILPEHMTTSRDLRDRIYQFMCRVTEEENSYAYIEYRPRETAADDSDGGM